MKYLKLMSIIVLATIQQSYAQNKSDDEKQINKILEEYTRCVAEKDSVAFYKLFNKGTVIWAMGVKEKSQAKIVESGDKSSNYSSGSHKDFMRAISTLKAPLDKFDNLTIIQDGTVASVTMDYSFWPDGKMSNWGGKYLQLIKIDGTWKIISVIYSIEYAELFKQPSLKERQKLNKIKE